MCLSALEASIIWKPGAKQLCMSGVSAANALDALVMHLDGIATTMAASVADLAAGSNLTMLSELLDDPEFQVSSCRLGLVILWWLEPLSHSCT